MRTETIKSVIFCDRCHPKGSEDYPNRVLRHFRRAVISASDRIPTGWYKGWWIGRKWQLCKACAVIEKKQSRAGRSKIINLNEQREAV